MSTFKKVLAWTIVVISIVGILACAAGVVGGWMLNNRLTDRLVNLLSGVQALTTSIEEPLTMANSSLNTVNTTISTLRDLGAQLKENASENSPIYDRITQAIQEDLSPTIDRLREIFTAVWERVNALNSAIETLNLIPGVDLPTLSPQLEAVSQEVQSMKDSAEQLRTAIVDFKAGVVENVLAAFSARIDPIANLLANLEQLVNTTLERIDNLQAGLASLQEKIPTIIDLITIVSTIVLLWLLLAQVSLILATRYYLKYGRMLWEPIAVEPLPQDQAVQP